MSLVYPSNFCEAKPSKKSTRTETPHVPPTEWTVPPQRALTSPQHGGRTSNKTNAFLTRSKSVHLQDVAWSVRLDVQLSGRISSPTLRYWRRKATLSWWQSFPKTPTAGWMSEPLALWRRTRDTRLGQRACQDRLAVEVDHLRNATLAAKAGQALGVVLDNLLPSFVVKHRLILSSSFLFSICGDFCELQGVGKCENRI